MPRAWTIARREYLASVKTKGFIIGLLVAPLLMFGGLIAVIALRGQVDVKDRRIAVLDASGRLFPALVAAAEQRNTEDVHDKVSGRKLKPAYLLEPVAAQPADLATQRLAVSERIRRGELHALLELGPEILHPGTNPGPARASYYAKGAALDDARRWLERPLNDALRRLRLGDSGIDESQVKDVFRWSPVEGMGLVTADPRTGAPVEARRSSEFEAVGAPMVSVILMWIMVMTGAAPLLGAALEEKTSRISEVLLGCATPFDMMLGKLLGSVGVALTGSVVYLAGILFALLQLGVVGLFPFGLLPWFFAYVILAILMVGANSLALGAACNDSRDAQNLSIPALLPILIPMFLLGPVLKEPHSTFATIASFVPPFTPVLMLLRQATPVGVPAWQPWLGLIGMLAGALIVVFAASRVFRVALLMQGKTPKLADLVRWAWRG